MEWSMVSNVLPTRDGVNLKICYFGLEIESQFFSGKQTLRTEKLYQLKDIIKTRDYDPKAVTIG